MPCYKVKEIHESPGDDPKSRGVLGQRAVRIPVFATEGTEFTEKGLGLKGGCISVNTALDLGLIEG